MIVHLQVQYNQPKAPTTQELGYLTADVYSDELVYGTEGLIFVGPRKSLMTLDLAEGVGTARCVALADESCNEPILGFAEPRDFSTRSLTSNGSWAHALQCLWVTLHVCTRICHRHICQSSISVYETWQKPYVGDKVFRRN